MWNDAEKQDVLSNIKDAWVDISNACVAWGFDECDEFNEVDTALDNLLTAMREVPAKQDSDIVRNVKLDTHGWSDEEVRDIWNKFIQDSVDKNLQDKS